MKGKTILILSLIFIILSGLPARASWFIDAERFHISVHGRLSCTDCHGDIVKKARHPDPAEVNKELSDFFRVEQCTGCHNSVSGNLDKGFHGSIKVKNRDDYTHCIGCHEPHYGLSKSGASGQAGSPLINRKPCGACHESRTALPALSSEDDSCMGCHRLPESEDPRGTEKIFRFCSGCHGDNEGKRVSSKALPLIDVSKYRSSTHSKLSCITCHSGAAGFNHANQGIVNCRQCHPPHHEKVTHDAHSGVACEACHLQGVIPVRDPVSGFIKWQADRKPGITVDVHSMIRSGDDNLCIRCHFSGNKLGVSAMVLPAKSIICMPCHAATFSAGDAVTVVPMLIFLLGVGILASIRLSGSLNRRNEEKTGKRLRARSNFSFRIFPAVRAFFLDAVLQRRLFRLSKIRWMIHALIFFPFIFRFSWGIIALVSSLLAPEWPAAWVMLNRNHPTGAFLFDLSGVMVISGIILAAFRGVLNRSRKLPGLPKKDWVASGLICCIVVTGFLLEGMRIAMTGFPDGTGYAFLGYGIGLLISRFTAIIGILTDIFGYMWYSHAILTGVFAAYLPFSRMLHIFIAPVVIALNAGSDKR